MCLNINKRGRNKQEKERGQKGEKRGEEMLFNIYSLIFFTNITYLNVFLLFFIVFISYFSTLCLFLSTFIYRNFLHLLVGDQSMNVLYLRFFLCCLENFSIFCRCISTFLRMFCNLLASHFLMLLFCDFVVFFLVICIIFSSFFCVFFCLICFFCFFCFLFALELFCTLLQIYIFCNMIFQLWSDFLLFFCYNISSK